jgi:Family of unknown function (DUF6326)
MSTRAILSTLWIFAVLNYLYCDVVSFMDSALLKQYLAGSVGGMQITQGFLLGGAVLMEVSMGMVLLSRLLPFKANRIANTLAGVITTSAQTATLFLGKPAMYYLFFSVIEISCTAFIVVYTWKWLKPDEVVTVSVSK